MGRIQVEILANSKGAQEIGVAGAEQVIEAKQVASGDIRAAVEGLPLVILATYHRKTVLLTRREARQKAEGVWRNPV